MLCENGKIPGNRKSECWQNAVFLRRYLEKGERQKRARRLITKGAAIECLAPATKDIGETEFLSLMEKILALPDVLALLPKEDAE